MSLELCILASGSMGNCGVVRTPAGVMLIDAGIGPRTTAKRLEGTGVCVRDIRAICLTHLDSDHFRPSWIRTIISHDIRVYCHESRQHDLIRSAADDCDDSHDRRRFRERVQCFNGEVFEPLATVRVESIRLAHDKRGSHGFVLDGFGARIGYASDLGRVPRTLLDRFVDLDVLAIESNCDTDMEIDSPRPWFLKNRIMGGRGHLSNGEALAAIRVILDRSQRRGWPLPRHIVLLHRSRQCNCPKLVRRLFSTDPRIAERLVLAEQFDRSEWLRPARVHQAGCEQLTLAW